MKGKVLVAFAATVIVGMAFAPLAAADSLVTFQTTSTAYACSRSPFATNRAILGSSSTNKSRMGTS